MTKKLLSGIYSFQIPTEWKIQHNEDGSTAVFNPSGKGAITISSYSSSITPDPVSALEKFVKGKGVVKSRKIGQFNAAESQYEDATNESLVVVYAVTVSHDNQLLLISYNSKKEDFSQDELNLVKRIVETVAFNNPRA